MSSNAAEVQRLLARARTWVERLGLPVRCWISDKQDAFATGIAAEFPDVPHRLCSNHFLRDLAKPMLDADSHAKVQMRKKVRGLREIEREVLTERATAAETTAAETTAAETTAAETTAAETTAAETTAAETTAAETTAAEASPTVTVEDVVLDYCATIRGILNDNQGGPLEPPGERMAEALTEVWQSLQRNLEAKKGGPRRTRLSRLAERIEEGLAEVADERAVIQQQMVDVRVVAETLDPDGGRLTERRAQFATLQERFAQRETPFHEHLSKMMANWMWGLFAGGKAGNVPWDNLDLERWFRLPKGHERRIHGRQHAGIRLVREGPTLLLALDAHREHDEPFTAEELHPYRNHPVPADQTAAQRRHQVMRRARSKKQRPKLLNELEQRYLDGS